MPSPKKAHSPERGRMKEMVSGLLSGCACKKDRGKHIKKRITYLKFAKYKVGCMYILYGS